MDVRDIAQQWRVRMGYEGRGGVVVVFDGVAGAWVDCLRNPEHWRIGAVAVDEGGRMWVAGGVQVSDDDSASCWEPARTVDDLP
jgi:hypothetical protein